MFENQKKYGNKRNFYINLYPKDRVDVEFTGSTDIIYYI